MTGQLISASSLEIALKTLEVILKLHDFPQSYTQIHDLFNQFLRLLNNDREIAGGF